MAKELERLSAYIEKLQRDGEQKQLGRHVDNFECLYKLKRSLAGERASSEPFGKMRPCDHTWPSVSSSRIWQMHPPQGLIQQIKDAVNIIKENADVWDQTISRKIAAIDIMKTRQSQFFSLLLSAIRGCLVFVATFFSGLAADAVWEGRLGASLHLRPSAPECLHQAVDGNA
ncbi:unnamed protein product [Symbiodinium natans]|uniref:Uncharacterized protein n=1 Tax=Symbiodinium natans TaxID=878477 RepID=A0A812J5C6_9DINO|nr:unnamed protein product [Symbiodinium natans]